MKTDAIITINDKTNYLTALEAVTGEKRAYTEEDKAKLLEIYADNAKYKFGFESGVLIQAILSLDVPGVNLLDKADADALTALAGLCESWTPDVEKAGPVKAAALSGDVSGPLALALARAALDAYAGQQDLAPYREDIKALAELLRSAEEGAFAEAYSFLIRVRERARG